jgi:hypothetical protein
VALPPHVYTSEAWALVAQHLRGEITKAQLALEAPADERKSDRLRGRIAFARQLLQDAEPSRIPPLAPPVDY